MEIHFTFCLLVTIAICFMKISAQITTTEGPDTCKRQMDLVILLDSSNSVGPTNFKTLIDTTINAVRTLDFGADRVRVAYIAYSKNITAYSRLLTSEDLFISGISSIPYIDESTYTDLAIQLGTDILTQDPRPGVPKTMFLITDGTSSKITKTMEESLRAASLGIDKWGVGVGAAANFTELEQYASGGKSQVFHLQNFYPDFLVNLTKKVCNETVTRPTFDLPTTTTPTPREFTNPDLYTELCKDSLSIGGVGHVQYPGDCTKVIQCYYNPTTNKTLAVARQCPNGQFWDSTCFKCANSSKVDCPYDKCKPDCSGNVTGFESFPMDGVCGGYWLCQKNRSYPMCCPPCYEYVAGYGCKFGTTCFDSCGVEEECPEGLGVCEKIPNWANINNYSVMNDSVGFIQSTCMASNLSIVDCKCKAQVTTFMQSTSVCTPYYASMNSVFECSGVPTSLSVKMPSTLGPFAIRTLITLRQPDFALTLAPTTAQCTNNSKLTIWSDSNGIHAFIGNYSGIQSHPIVPLKNITGSLDILVVYFQGLLTLAVTQDRTQFVATSRVKSSTLCTDCTHTIAATSSRSSNCLVTLVELSNCKPEITGIYTAR